MKGADKGEQVCVDWRPTVLRSWVQSEAQGPNETRNKGESPG